MSPRKTDKTSKPAGLGPAKRKTAPGRATAPLPESMVTGKASPAKAAVGDKPVFAYIASLPQPQRGIAGEAHPDLPLAGLLLRAQRIPAQF